MSKKPIISIIIGSFNQCNILKKILPFYEEVDTSFDLFEVIIVDSSSTDGTEEFLKSYKPRFNLKYSIQPNHGKAVARNNAANLAKGEILLITDSDMIPEKNFIQGHIQAHHEAKSPTCFQGLAWNLSSLDLPINHNQLTPQVGSFPKHMSKLGWYYFLTGNISIPKSLFDSEAGFNDLFVGYGWEDLELGYRLSLQKIPLLYLKTSVNYHYHIISKEEEIDRNVKKGESATLFLKLHPELKWFLGFNPLSVFIFSLINERSFIYRYFFSKFKDHTASKMHNLAFWFLKEYNYLKGARNAS
jgi:glycosyltransferase involved in cell wall biosynthesis